MSIDLKKLESLGCLSLSQEQRDEILAAVQANIETLKSVADIQAAPLEFPTTGNTQFRTGDFSSPDKQGLNIGDDSYFLAPKTVKKD